jgi:hypothetical protein
LNHETIDTGLAAQAAITDFAKTALSLVGQGIGVSDRAKSSTDLKGRLPGSGSCIGMSAGFGMECGGMVDKTYEKKPRESLQFVGKFYSPDFHS